MIGESRVDEWFLALQGFDRAATRLSILIERLVDQFGKELRDRA
jgi:hypothetical protein